jgi:hypothetical protein
MRTNEDIEAYLARTKYRHQEIEEGTWVVKDVSGANEQIVLKVTDDVALFRVNVLELESIDPTKKAELHERCLELNGNDMVHGAYGIAGGRLVLTASLRMENLDYNELVGTLDDFGVALSKHVPGFAVFRKAQA